MENIKLIDLANGIENKIKELTKYNPQNPKAGGVAFPTGLNINNCAAHWSPNPKDTTQILGPNDIIKIDWGVHINGCITDGAFSFSFNDKFEPLIAASQEATSNAIQMAGPDVYLGDIGEATQEIIESYEVDLTGNGTTTKLKSIGDLSGHQIGKYQIHCGKPVPNIRYEPLMGNNDFRMYEGEFYAIETFPTTGDAVVYQDSNPNNCSHYMANYNNHLKYNDDIINRKKYTAQLESKFGTLAFCKRWMHDFDLYNENLFNKAVKKKIYEPHPPLYDSTPNSFVAQTENTIYINPKGAITLN